MFVIICDLGIKTENVYLCFKFVNQFFGSSKVAENNYGFGPRKSEVQKPLTLGKTIVKIKV